MYGRYDLSAPILTFIPRAFPGTVCRVFSNVQNNSYYEDTHHLSKFGVQLYVQEVIDKLLF
jgi:hypothetical protein